MGLRTYLLIAILCLPAAFALQASPASKNINTPDGNLTYTLTVTNDEDTALFILFTPDGPFSSNINMTANTTIEPGTKQQFNLTVTIPENLSAGKLEGGLLIESSAVSDGSMIGGSSAVYHVIRLITPELNLTGNVTNSTEPVNGTLDNITDDVETNLTTNLTGDLTGNLTINITENLTGNYTNSTDLNITIDIGDIVNATLNLTNETISNITSDVTVNLTSNETLNITENVTVSEPIVEAAALTAEEPAPRRKSSGGGGGGYVRRAAPVQTVEPIVIEETVETQAIEPLVESEVVQISNETIESVIAETTVADISDDNIITESSEELSSESKSIISAATALLRQFASYLLSL